jgi:hypothetical protein
MDGEYTVSDKGMVSLPLIGDIPAAGHDVQELARTISARLEERSGGAEKPLAAVEIVQFRPFFIVGDVEKPGEYPYKPGLTVLQAIGIAGGYYRRPGGDVATARGEIDSQSAKLRRLMAREARFAAAVANAAEISFPAELTRNADEPRVAELLDSERAALATERAIAANEQRSLETIRSLYTNEIATLQAQSGALQTERQTVDREVQDLRALANRGLTVAASQIALERTLAQIDTERLGLAGEIVKARENIELAEQHVRRSAQERARVDMRELQDARDQITETRIRQRQARDLLDEAQVGAPPESQQSSDEGGGGTRGAPVITRKEGDSARDLVSDEATPVEPNDIVRIAPLRRHSAARVGATPGSPL